MADYDDALRFLTVDPSAMRCPVEAFSALRSQAPVVEIPEMDLFIVMGRQEVLSVYRDAKTFSSAQHANLETALNAREMLTRASRLAAERGEFSDLLDPDELQPQVLPFTDAPIHTVQRQLIRPAFTMRRARASEPMLSDIASGLIDQFIHDGSVELRTQYSDPLMVQFILRELHCLPSDAPFLLAWVSDFTKTMGSKLTDAELEEAALARVEYNKYFLEKIEEVREHPADDLLTSLVHSRVDGQGFTTGDLLMIIQTLLVGGTETSSTTTSKAMLYLATHPDDAQRVREDSTLLPKFVEETLRLNGPIHLQFRRTTREVEVGGVTIPKGARVGLHLGAAGRDPDGCPMPNSFDLDRDPPHNLMFGYGPHLCAGAELARVQVRVAVGRLLERTKHLELGVAEESLSFWPQINLHRLKALPLRFTAA